MVQRMRKSRPVRSGMENADRHGSEAKNDYFSMFPGPQNSARPSTRSASVDADQGSLAQVFHSPARAVAWTSAKNADQAAQH